MGKVLYRCIVTAEAPEGFVISIEHHPVLPFRHQDAVIAVGLLRVKVVDEKQAFAKVCKYVVILFVPCFYKGLAWKS